MFVILLRDSISSSIYAGKTVNFSTIYIYIHAGPRSEGSDCSYNHGDAFSESMKKLQIPESVKQLKGSTWTETDFSWVTDTIFIAMYVVMSHKSEKD